MNKDKDDEGMSGSMAMFIVLVMLASLAVFIPVVIHVLVEIVEWSWNLVGD